MWDFKRPFLINKAQNYSHGYVLRQRIKHYESWNSRNHNFPILPVALLFWKTETVISRSPSASSRDWTETDGCSTPEMGTADGVGLQPNYTLAPPVLVQATGTTAVPGPCLSHVPHAHVCTTFAVPKKFSKLHEVGISVCIPAPMDSCAFYSLPVLTISLGKNKSNVLYLHWRPPLTPHFGSPHPNSNVRVIDS